MILSLTILGKIMILAKTGEIKIQSTMTLVFLTAFSHFQPQSVERLTVI